MKTLTFLQGTATIGFVLISVVYNQLQCDEELIACGEQAVQASGIEDDREHMRRVTKQQFCLARESFTQCYHDLDGRCDVEDAFAINMTFEFLKTKNAYFKCEEPDTPVLSCPQTFDVCKQKAEDVVKTIDNPKYPRICYYFKELELCHGQHIAQGRGCDPDFQDYYLTQHGMGLEKKCGNLFLDCEVKKNGCFESAIDAVPGFEGDQADIVKLIANFNKEQFCMYAHTLAFCSRDIEGECPFAAHQLATGVNALAGYPRCNADECALSQRKCLGITDRNVLNFQGLLPFIQSKKEICGFKETAQKCSQGLSQQCGLMFKSTIDMLQTFSDLAACDQKNQ